MAHGAKRDRLGEQAIAALLAYPTVQSAAEAVGISDKTLRDWMKESAFKADYLEARRACISQASGALARAASKAVSALEAVLDDSEAPAGVRVSAARTALEYAFRGIETEDLAARIEALESEAEEAGKQ